MIETSYQYRLNYWSEKGQDELIGLCQFSSTLTPEERRGFEDVIWKNCDTFGVNQKAISGGIRHYAVHLAQNGTEIKPVAQRSASRYSQRLWHMAIKTYLDSNVVRHSTESSKCNAFLVEKKPQPGIPPMKTLADLENPAITDEDITASWRLILDLAQVSRACQDFNTSTVSPRDILSTFSKDRVCFTLDCLSFFSEICLNRNSQHLNAFCGGCPQSHYCMTRLPQGAGPSPSTASHILSLILKDLIIPGESFIYIDNICFT